MGGGDTPHRILLFCKGVYYVDSKYCNRISRIAVEDYLLLTYHCFVSDYGQLLIRIFTTVLKLSKKITKLLKENGTKQESCERILLKISVKCFIF